MGAYVTQDDFLYEYFTPREALTFSARLRLKCSVRAQDERVENLMKELGLTANANTMIGGANSRKMMSGGERKRTAIGVELITDPSVIFLDEPTSGLDSFKALALVKTLRDLSRKNRTIISTIHMPSS
jgi:ABC-type multidrug transport system ATPase subunit